MTEEDAYLSQESEDEATESDADNAFEDEESEVSSSDTDNEVEESGPLTVKTKKIVIKTDTKCMHSGSVTAPKPHALPPKANISDPEQYVLDYMIKTNRPYSILNVFENLHKAISKPSLTRIMDSLATKNELEAKVYGKTTIYYCKQSNLPTPSKEEQSQIETRIRALENDVFESEKQLRAAETLLTNIHSQISDEDLHFELEKLTNEEKELTQNIAKYKFIERKPILPQHKKLLKKKHEDLRKAWVVRKRIVLDAVDQIADGMEVKVKDVYKICDIEKDPESGIPNSL